MQKHIRYEVEIIADSSDAPSLAQLHWFFLDCIRSAEKTATSQPEDQAQPRRGRPRKSPPAATPSSPPASNRPEEQLFTIRRTETPLDVYLGELDEAVEKLKSQQASPPQPAQIFDPKWLEPDRSQIWRNTQAPTCNSKDPKFTISGVSYLPGEPFPASEIDEQATREGLVKMSSSTQPLSEIDETA